MRRARRERACRYCEEPALGRQAATGRGRRLGRFPVFGETTEPPWAASARRAPLDQRADRRARLGHHGARLGAADTVGGCSGLHALRPRPAQGQPLAVGVAAAGVGENDAAAVGHGWQGSAADAVEDSSAAAAHAGTINLSTPLPILVFATFTRC
jgi:hypothetical protein